MAATPCMNMTLRAEDLKKVLFLLPQRMEDAFPSGTSVGGAGTFYPDGGSGAGRADKNIFRYGGAGFAPGPNPVSVVHVRSLADRLHVSESTLSKRFRAETGMSPGVYLEQLVIQKACRLLIEEDKSMAQIAEELDFSDQFYFLPAI